MFFYNLHFFEGFIDDRRSRDCNRRDDLSWDGRENSMDPERQYMHHAQLSHQHKDWDNDDYHGDWNRQDRHWQHRDAQHKVNLNTIILKLESIYVSIIEC